MLSLLRLLGSLLVVNPWWRKEGYLSLILLDGFLLPSWDYRDSMS